MDLRSTIDVVPAIDYVILSVLILLAFASLAFGLARVALRSGLGRAEWRVLLRGGWRRLPELNGRAFLLRGLMLARLFGRPVAGTAHALLFFGSLILIFGHAVFPLYLLGVPIFEGRFGFWVMALGRDVGGAAALIGLLLLLVRRLHPPAALVEPRSRSGFLAMELLLLFAILAGFGVEAVRIANLGPHPGKVIGEALAAFLRPLGDTFFLYRFSWWLHGLLGLGFLALIAHTPLVHMVLGPLNSALARRRPGIELPRIDFEALEQADAETMPPLGASRLSHFGIAERLAFATCLWCGRCDEVCPAHQTGRALSPKGVITTLAEYLEQGRLEDDSVVEAIGAEPVFDCVTCGACMDACPVSIRQPEAILSLRRHYAMERSELPETMAHANRNLERRGHPFVGTAANPEDWKRGLEVPLYERGRTDYLLWVGCATLYEERAQRVARAMVRILSHAGVSFGVLERPRCTGDPAKQLGNEMLFAELAQGTIEELERLEARKLITLCAHCYNSFDRYYPQLGARYEVTPHAVLLDRLLAEGRLKLRAEPSRVTFHDPCYLARHNAIVAPPRRVVDALAERVEMPRHGRANFCCGAGGANYWANPGGGRGRIDLERAREALATGADRIATACPFCLLMLTEAVKQQGEDSRVFDLAELVEQRLIEQGNERARPPSRLSSG